MSSVQTTIASLQRVRHTLDKGERDMLDMFKTAAHKDAQSSEGVVYDPDGALEPSNLALDGG